MTDEFLVILQAYGYSVVPLSAWQTADIVRMIELMDAELQQRAEDDVTFDDGDYPFEDDVWEDDGV
jgi:hypothetical protein